MGKIVAGIDVGSLTTKAVLIDTKEKERILSFAIVRSGTTFRDAVETAMGQVKTSAGLQGNDIAYAVSTGYGRGLVPFAGRQVTEITCHARGVKRLFPEAHTVIDVGGQDSKVIRMDDRGGVSNFIMNDKCAAGTGRFLEVMAGALDVEIDKLGDLSFQSGKDVQVSSMCTVFAESEVISLLSKDCKKADIAAGIHNAIARRLAGMVSHVGLIEKVVMVGGVAKNHGVVKSLERILGTIFLIPDEPQITGALGAAIIALEHSH